MDSPGSEIINLDKENELKITIDNPNDKLTLQLIDGSAEIFGSELLIGDCYKFLYFSSFTIFTFHGCTLKLRREASKCCIYKINSYKEIPEMIDLHYYLQERRHNAEINKREGPVTLIVGPTDSGKSTLCRLLLNYAVKQCQTPVFIDLDVGQGSLSPSGTFGILTVEEPSDIYGQFNENDISIYFFGYKSPGHNMKLYKLLLEKLGQSLQNRFHQEHLTRTSGAIINTCGWIDGEGYNLIKDAVTFFNVNTIFVLAARSLSYKLKQDFSRQIKVIDVSKRKSTVVRDKNIRAKNRNDSVYKYFYGSSRLLQPHTFNVNFNDLQIFKAKSSKNIKSCNSNPGVSENSNLVAVPIDPRIVNFIFGLSYADCIEDILLSSIYGFISIVEIDMDSEIASVLSPRPGPLPTKYLLMGDIMLTDS